jgi:hypothetical protein
MANSSGLQRRIHLLNMCKRQLSIEAFWDEMQRACSKKTKWKTLNPKLYVHPIVGDLQQVALRIS